MDRKQRWLGRTFIGVSLSLVAVVTPAVGAPKKSSVKKGKTKYSLRTFEYKTASVLPSTTFGAARENYILVGRESSGSAQGTYGSFGAGIASGDNHPAKTAARGLAGGAFDLLGNTQELRSQIDSRGKSTRGVIATLPGQDVIYMTNFPSKRVDQAMNSFHLARAQAFEPGRATFTTAAGGIQHKDSLAIVRKDRFVAAIKKVKHDNRFKLIGPIKVTAQVQHADGSRKQKQIVLDPAFVNSVEIFYKLSGRFSCTPAKESKVKVCRDGEGFYRHWAK